MIPAFELVSSTTFAGWLESLSPDALARVLAKVRQLSLGNEGDAKPVGKGVRELRIHTGPGYRVYFKRLGPRLILLLAGGDKSGQSADIKRAIEIAKNYERRS